MSFPHCAALVTTFPYVIFAHALRFFKVPYIFPWEKCMIRTQDEFQMPFYSFFSLTKVLRKTLFKLEMVYVGIKGISICWKWKLATLIFHPNKSIFFMFQHEERSHEPGMPYSWEAVDIVSANYTPDITPLILAAHKNNYEILKILLDRGASLPTPHDLKCSCEACITGM